MCTGPMAGSRDSNLGRWIRVRSSRARRFGPCSIRTGKTRSRPTTGCTWYEKILAERVVLGDTNIEGVVLRLPKVYGPGGNADFATVRGYRHQPQWRWTHGYVENVAAAIALAAVHRSPVGRVYNVGEEYTPTVSERLQDLPDLEPPTPPSPVVANFAQDIVYDTTRIRRELGYTELVPYEEGIRRTVTDVIRRAAR